MNIFTQFFSKKSKNPDFQRQQIITDLMRREAKIGSEVFGPVPKGTTREFFCLDDSTWVWFEQNATSTKTTRYIVQDKAVFKSVNNGHFESVSKQELKHLERAAELYAERVQAKLYARPTTS